MINVSDESIDLEYQMLIWPQPYTTVELKEGLTKLEENVKTIIWAHQFICMGKGPTQTCRLCGGQITQAMRRVVLFREVVAMRESPVQLVVEVPHG